MQQDIVAIELCISKHGINITKPKTFGIDFGNRYSLADLEYAALKAYRKVGRGGGGIYYSAKIKMILVILVEWQKVWQCCHLW